MSSKSIQTAQEIEAQLDTKIREMEEFQHNSNYVQAEKSRVAIEQLKKDFEARKLYELQQKHRREVNELEKTHEEQMDHFNKFWDKKMEDFYADSQKGQKEMAERHQRELYESRELLDRETPIKLKESSQLLNLRKMQEHMAKQKNYVEAQKVKERCNEMEKQQKDIWMNNRNLKIESAINKIKQRQESQLSALLKNQKQGMDELAKERKEEESRLQLKYTNVCKDLKMQQDKQILSHKGQFKSKGGSPSSPQMTRSKVGFNK